MNFVSRHYDAQYFSRVMAPLMRDDEYYQLKSVCAAVTYFGRFPRPYGKILEYGCGIGQNIANLEGAVGYDISAAATLECQRRGVATIARRDDIPRQHFDYVLCRHVLEHVEQPLALVQELLGYLRDEGRLILVVPQERHRPASFDPDVNRHLYCWNFRTINNLIWSAGGVSVFNRVEPMFGRRIHLPLQPLRRMCGISAYLRLARAAGWLMNEPELVVHCRKRGAETVPTT